MKSRGSTASSDMRRDDGADGEAHTGTSSLCGCIDDGAKALVNEIRAAAAAATTERERMVADLLEMKRAKSNKVGSGTTKVGPV